MEDEEQEEITIDVHINGELRFTLKRDNFIIHKPDNWPRLLKLVGDIWNYTYRKRPLEEES